MSTIQETSKDIKKEIKQTRIKINNHLDKLQKDLTKQLYLIKEKEKSRICQLLSSLGNIQKEIAESQKIKTHSTDLQMFLSMKQIDKDVDTNDKLLQSFVGGEKLKQNSLSFKINASIQNIMSDIIIALEKCVWNLIHVISF